jgi:hypothetical protein
LAGLSKADQKIEIRSKLRLWVTKNWKKIGSLNASDFSQMIGSVFQDSDIQSLNRDLQVELEHTLIKLYPDLKSKVKYFETQPTFSEVCKEYLGNDPVNIEPPNKVKIIRGEVVFFLTRDNYIILSKTTHSAGERGIIGKKYTIILLKDGSEGVPLYSDTLRHELIHSEHFEYSKDKDRIIDNDMRISSEILAFIFQNTHRDYNYIKDTIIHSDSYLHGMDIPDLERSEKAQLVTQIVDLIQLMEIYLRNINPQYKLSYDKVLGVFEGRNLTQIRDTLQSEINAEFDDELRDSLKFKAKWREAANNILVLTNFAVRSAICATAFVFVSMSIPQVRELFFGNNTGSIQPTSQTTVLRDVD